MCYAGGIAYSVCMCRRMYERQSDGGETGEKEETDYISEAQRASFHKNTPPLKMEQPDRNAPPYP